MMAPWTTSDIPDQTGKTAVITGANTGLGYCTALELARAGANVVLTARNEQKGQDALTRLRAIVPSAQVSLELLDLASLKSIADFATRMEGRYDGLDLLINNAGVASPRTRLLTEDGFELQFGVNFLGHFALTARLLPLLRRATAPRVVTLSSLVHKYGKINFGDLQGAQRYSPVGAYNQSKLATLIFARELQRRAEQNDWKLLSVAAHPGIARTELTKAREGQPVIWFNSIFDRISPLFTGTAAGGAQPTLYAAVSPAVVGGGYYGPTGLGEIKGPPGTAASSPQSNDPVLAERLWGVAEECTGLSF